MGSAERENYSSQQIMGRNRRAYRLNTHFKEKKRTMICLRCSGFMVREELDDVKSGSGGYE